MADPEAAAIRQPLTSGGQVSIVDVAEDSSLGCVLSVVFFVSIAGGVWMFAEYETSGGINLALVVLFFSSMAILAMGAVVYTYLQASGRMEVEEAEQHRVERFRHYARQRLSRGGQGGYDQGGNARAGAYGSCDPAQGAVLTGNIYTATVSPHAFVVQKEGGTYRVLPASGYPAPARSPSPLEALGVGPGGVNPHDLPPVLAMPVGMPIYTPFVAAPDVQVQGPRGQPPVTDQQWSQAAPGGPVPGLGGHVIGIAVQPPSARAMAAAANPASGPPSTSYGSSAAPGAPAAASAGPAAPVAVVAGAPAAQGAGMPTRWAGSTGSAPPGTRLSVEEMRQQALRGQTSRPASRVTSYGSSNTARASGRGEDVAVAAGARLERLQMTNAGPERSLSRIGRLPVAPGGLEPASAASQNGRI